MKTLFKLCNSFVIATLLASLLWGALPISHVHAAGLITITSSADTTGGDGVCTLREAITNANNDAATYGDCAGGSGADTLTFAPALAGSVISLATIGDTTLGPTALGVTSNITILGDANEGITIERNSSAAEMRLFYVSPGAALTLKYLTLQGGLARGYDGGVAWTGGSGGGAAGVGGAIFNRGTLTLDSLTLLNNQAIGGNGASWISWLPAPFNREWGGGGGGVGSAGGASYSGNPVGGGPNGGAYTNPNNNDATGPGGGGGGGVKINNDNYLLAGNGGDFGGGGGGRVGGTDDGPPGGMGGFGGGGGGGGATKYLGPGCAASSGLGGVSAYGGGTGGRGFCIMSYELIHHSGTGGGGAGMGGALFNDTGGAVTVVNSTLVANTARGGNGGDNIELNNYKLYSGGGGGGLGGAIFNRAGALTLLNATLAGNNVIAGSAGAGDDASRQGANGARRGSEVYTYGAASVVNVTNTIMANSSSAFDYFVNDSSTVNGSHNLIMRASGIPAGVIATSADPLLAALADNGGPTQTRAPGSGSPAINTGTGSGAPVLDQRGAGRDETPDMGAYEVMGSEWVVNSPADTVAADGLTTLREAIHRANGQLGPHSIRFAAGMAGQTINFNAAAEDNTFGPSTFRIDYAVTIDAAGVEGIRIQRDSAASEMRLFYVAAGGSLTLTGITLSNGLARGKNGGNAGGGGGGGGAAGLGGAIFNQGTLTLNGVTLTGNQAIGGNGASGAYVGGGGGGGGGGLGSSGADSSGYDGGAGGGPNGGAAGVPGSPKGSAGGVGGGGGGGLSYLQSYPDYEGYNGGAGGFGGGGGGGGGGTSFYQKGLGGTGGFGAGAGGNSGNEYSSVSGGFGGGSNNYGQSGGGGAGMGGAIFNHAGTLSLVNTTLSGNSVQGGSGAALGSALGGAIFNRAGSVSLINSTLAFNTLAGSGTREGGALYSYADGSAAALTLVNSILSDSSGGSDAVNNGGTVSGSHNVIVNASGFDSVILSSASPNLGALANNGGPTFTHAIVPPSPALHNGTQTGAPLVDQRGIPRDTRPDIGAFELQASITFADPAGVCGGNIPCFTSIWGAIGGVTEGGFVNVYGGAYTETPALNKNVTASLLGDVTLNGSFTLGTGTFNAGAGNLTITENFTQSGGVFTTPGGELVISGDSSRTGGTVNYTANGTIQETRSISGLPTLNFAFCEVGVNVTGNTDLTDLQVVRHEQGHNQATSMTDLYWNINATGSGTITLTLPQPNLADPKVCRYTGGPGGGWDCARNGFSSTAVWRDGIASFSDWAVGNQVTTAVRLVSYHAQPSSSGHWGWAGIGFILVLSGVAFRKLRK
jgi:CSLREA domain-containing protein